MNDRSANIPPWMGTGDHPKCRPNNRATKTSAVEKTIRGIAAALRSSIYAERIAERDGLLQRIDPRVKLAALLLLLLAAALARNIATLVLMYASLILLAAWSAIPSGFFVRRVWLFIPVFAGIIVLPSIFNIVRPGDPLWTIWSFGEEVQLGPWSLGTSLAVTKQGLAGALLLIMRVAVSVSLAVLLALTTRWAELMRALRYFHVPGIFVLILSMTYRYIYVLLGQASDMYIARTSRLAGSSTPKEDRRFAAASIGTLLGSSHALSSEVYGAMVSRGYTGEPRSERHHSPGATDVAAAAVAVAVFALVLGGDRIILG